MNKKTTTNSYPTFGVQLVVEFVAGEVEADAWQRLAAELGMSDSRGGSRTSARRGARANRHNGDLQAFIADLGRVVDDCEVRVWIIVTVQWCK